MPIAPGSYPGSSSVPIRRAGEMPLPPAYQGHLYSDIGKGIRQTVGDAQQAIAKVDQQSAAEAERKRMVDKMIHDRRIAQEVRDSKAALDQANLEISQDKLAISQSQEKDRAEKIATQKERFTQGDTDFKSFSQQWISERERRKNDPNLTGEQRKVSKEDFKDMVVSSGVLNSEEGRKRIKDFANQMGYGGDEFERWYKTKYINYLEGEGRSRQAKRAADTDIKGKKHKGAIRKDLKKYAEANQVIGEFDDALSKFANKWSVGRGARFWKLAPKQLEPDAKAELAAAADAVFAGLKKIEKVPGEGNFTDADAKDLKNALVNEEMPINVMVNRLNALKRKINRGLQYIADPAWDYKEMHYLIPDDVQEYDLGYYTKRMEDRSRGPVQPGSYSSSSSTGPVDNESVDNQPGSWVDEPEDL